MTFEDKADALLKGSFPDFDYIPGTILIESMAQAGGAGVRLLGVTDGIFALVQIESAQFYAGARFGEQIRYVVKNARLSEKIIKQEGKAYIGDNLIFEASWMCPSKWVNVVSLQRYKMMNPAIGGVLCIEYYCFSI